MRREGRFWKRRRTMKVFGRGGGSGGGGERDDRGGAASAASMAGVAAAVKSEEEEEDGTTEKLASLSRCLLSRVDVVMEPSLWATAREGIRRLTIISRSFEEFPNALIFCFPVVGQGNHLIALFTQINSTIGESRSPPSIQPGGVGGGRFRRGLPLVHRPRHGGGGRGGHRR